MNRWRWLLGRHALVAIAIAAAAFGLRWRALAALPVDYDEVYYLPAAQEIAGVLRSGDLAGLTEANARPEHPQLMKILLGVAILPAPDSTPSPRRGSVYSGGSRLPEAELLFARFASAVFGALEVLLLAWIQPLAGLFLAIHTYTIKYTSLVMLEALPAFTSLAAVASHVRFKQTRRNGWRIGSAILLGVSAAGKYMYAVVGIAILIDWWLELRPNVADFLAQARRMLLWGCGSLLVFFAAYPYLWPDPLARFTGSVSYHAAYSGGPEVRDAAFPFWQPLAWLTIYMQADAPAERPYLLRLDPLVTLLALFGLDRLWRKERLWVIWLVVGLLFLLLWNTKWPQYLLILSAPLALAAAEGTLRLLGGLGRVVRARRSAA
jgi:4-amino-4-deoxy-L-arabinose transferase-like glycosyltransferase